MMSSWPRMGWSACSRLETAPFDVVLTDVRMPGPDGFELARLIRKRWPLTEVVFMTAFASIPEAVDAMRLGAYDYITKPFHPDDVTLVIARALERQRERARIHDPAAATAQLAAHSYREALAEARDRGSREYLEALMRTYGGNVSRAAQRAGLEREVFTDCCGGTESKLETSATPRRRIGGESAVGRNRGVFTLDLTGMFPWRTL